MLTNNMIRKQCSTLLGKKNLKVFLCALFVTAIVFFFRNTDHHLIYNSNNNKFISPDPSDTKGYYLKLGNLDPKVYRDVATRTQNDIKISSVVDFESCVTANDGVDVCTHLPPVVYKQTQTAPSEPLVGESREYGTWIWKSPDTMTDEYIDTVLKGATKYGINTIYVTVDDYLLIHNLADGPIKDKKKINYTASLERFIKLANDRGIQVDVEAGWKDWTKESNAYKSEVIIDYAIEYNNTHLVKIRGVQFDVEPYLLPEYENNKLEVLTSFVVFIDKSAYRLANSNLQFNVVIPHFYDSEQKWTPAVIHNGESLHTFEHLLKILNRKPGNSIILMAYRNFAEGHNGSIQISESEIRTASTNDYRTKIIIAQETGSVSPEYVTFHNTSRALYEKQISLIEQTFNGYKNFGGLSVHYIDPFLELR